MLLFQRPYSSAVETSGAGDWPVEMHQRSSRCSQQGIPVVYRSFIEVDMDKWLRQKSTQQDYEGTWSMFLDIISCDYMLYLCFDVCSLH